MLKKIIQERNLKQVAIAKCLSVDNSQVSLWLNQWKRIPAKHIPKLSELLGIPEQELIKINTKENK